MDADVIIIGSGAGGGTLARALADSGLQILILERGDYLPREWGNWDPQTVFGEHRYHTDEQWRDQHGKAFSPVTGYHVGGNTKFYGAAVLRRRAKDFSVRQHQGGETRAWVEGEAFAFDDTIEHEAWNDSDALRAVLIFDVWNPHLTPLEQQLLARYYAAADQSSHRPPE